MDFTLTDEQELLRDTARNLLTKECPISLVRAHMDDRAAAEPLWRDHLREWVALGDGELVDHCLFLEECGAVLAPGPYFSTSALLLPLLRAIGDERADAVAAGELRGTVAMAGRSGVWEVSGDEVRSFVVDLDLADVVAIVLPGPAVVVVDAASVESRRVEVLDSTRPCFELTVPGSLDTTPIDAGVLHSVVRRATVAIAAETIGTSRWLLDSSVAYAKERVQFDRPIGSFQGLQYKLVDMALDHERAVAAVYYAAMAHDAGDPDAADAAHVAKAAAGTAAKHAARDGMQVHGGIGYTWEHDLHLYLRRAYTNESLLGTTSWHHDRLADGLFPPT